VTCPSRQTFKWADLFNWSPSSSHCGGLHGKLGCEFKCWSRLNSRFDNTHEQHMCWWMMVWKRGQGDVLGMLSLWIRHKSAIRPWDGRSKSQAKRPYTTWEVHSRLNPIHLKIRINPRLKDEFECWNSPCAWLAMCK